MERERNTTQMEEQTINTEVQKNEEEIGKQPKKEFRIMIAKLIKNLKNRMQKMQESISKDIEDLKNKHRDKKQLMKLKILQKESIAEYLKQKNKTVNWKINW